MPVAEFWRLASDTAWVNRAIGIPAWRYEPVLQDDGVTYLEARTRYLGLVLRWREYPFDWVHGRSFSAVREFQRLIYQVRVDTEMETLADGPACVWPLK